MQADIAACTTMGCEPLSVLTAITAQHRGGLEGGRTGGEAGGGWGGGGIVQVGLGMIEGQCRAAIKDASAGGGWGIAAVKIGMLGSPEVARLVAELLRGAGLRNIVLDPVLAATAGTKLGTAGTAQAIIDHLLPLADIVTPNLDEAKILSGHTEISSPQDCQKVWETLRGLGARGLLLKGGHAANWQGTEICDTLYIEGAVAEFKNPRIAAPDPVTHGTGCSLSSALAAGLAQGHDPKTATQNAIEFVRNRIQKHIKL